jgi:hypothetical protein
MLRTGASKTLYGTGIYILPGLWSFHVTHCIAIAHRMSLVLGYNRSQVMSSCVFDEYLSLFDKSTFWTNHSNMKWQSRTAGRVRGAWNGAESEPRFRDDKLA